MNKPKFTPGPWAVTVCGRRVLVRQETATRIGPNVCTVDVAGREYGKEAANARLIAAAPDLYDALSRIVETGFSAQAEAQARAALAKANPEEGA